MNVRTIVSVIFLFASACTKPPADEFAVVDIGKKDAERLVRFYAGAIDGVGGDSLVVHDGRRLLIRTDQIASMTGASTDMDGNGRLDWDELVRLVKATYTFDGRFPVTRDALERQTSYRDSVSSFTVELRGTMTTALRRIFVPRPALRTALEDLDEQNPEIVYPVGTTIVGEHWISTDLVETTAMTKRSDGFWDFYVYDGSGMLTDSTTTDPKPLHSPVQCAGCHFGSRTFEPEKSFPAPARPGPNGPRGFQTDVARVDPAIVSYLDEHRRRSDTVLGIYGTLFLGELIARGLDDLSAEDRALVERLPASLRSDTKPN